MVVHPHNLQKILSQGSISAILTESKAVQCSNKTKLPSMQYSGDVFHFLLHNFELKKRDTGAELCKMECCVPLIDN